MSMEIYSIWVYAVVFHKSAISANHKGYTHGIPSDTHGIPSLSLADEVV